MFSNKNKSEFFQGDVFFTIEEKIKLKNKKNFCLFQNKIESKEIALCASLIEQAKKEKFDVLLSSTKEGMELCNSLCNLLVHDRCFTHLTTTLTIEEQNKTFRMLVQLVKKENNDGRLPNGNISITINELAKNMKSSEKFGTLADQSQAIINELLEEKQPISNLGYKGYYR